MFSLSENKFDAWDLSEAIKIQTAFGNRAKGRKSPLASKLQLAATSTRELSARAVVRSLRDLGWAEGRTRSSPPGFIEKSCLRRTSVCRVERGLRAATASRAESLFASLAARRLGAVKGNLGDKRWLWRVLYDGVGRGEEGERERGREGFLILWNFWKRFWKWKMV